MAPVCQPSGWQTLQLELDLDAYKGVPEEQSSPLDSALNRSKRRRAFPAEIDTHEFPECPCGCQASSSTGLPQHVLDSLSSVALQGVMMSDTSCVANSAGMPQASLDSIAVHAENRGSLADSSIGDVALLRLRRLKAFGRTGQAAALAEEVMLHSLPDSQSIDDRACEKDTESARSCVESISETHLLRVKRARAFLGPEKGAAVAVAAWKNTAMHSQAPGYGGTDGIACHSKLLQEFAAPCAPRERRARKRKPVKLTIVVEDEDSVPAKPMTPNRGGA